MAYNQRDTAYDLSLFEDSSSAAPVLPEVPEKQSKKNNVVRITQKQIEKVRRRKHNYFKLAMGVTFAASVMVVVIAIIVGQVQLTELNSKISAAQDDLSIKQSINTQMEMDVNAALSTTVVEDYAQNTLGMSKATNAQKEFVNLSEGDKAEVIQEVKGNIFQSIAQAFTGLWS